MTSCDGTATVWLSLSLSSRTSEFSSYTRCFQFRKLFLLFVVNYSWLFYTFYWDMIVFRRRLAHNDLTKNVRRFCSYLSDFVWFTRESTHLVVGFPGKIILKSPFYTDYVFSGRLLPKPDCKTWAWEILCACAGMKIVITLW
mgnify:CR=1 FL=1